MSMLSHIICMYVNQTQHLTLIHEAQSVTVWDIQAPLHPHTKAITSSTLSQQRNWRHQGWCFVCCLQVCWCLCRTSPMQAAPELISRSPASIASPAIQSWQLGDPKLATGWLCFHLTVVETEECRGCGKKLKKPWPSFEPVPVTWQDIPAVNYYQKSETTPQCASANKRSFLAKS